MPDDSEKRIDISDFDALQTQGIKYAGSKKRLIGAILTLARKTKARRVWDGFAGTTRVSQAFARCGYQVTCSDIATWSGFFGECYLRSGGNPSAYVDLIEHLNAVKPCDGWFTKHYGGPENNGLAVHPESQLKKPWQYHNTRKIDGIRQEIDALNLDPPSKAVALTSLMLAADKVDSTLGHQASYLRRWSSRS